MGQFQDYSSWNVDRRLVESLLKGKAVAVTIIDPELPRSVWHILQWPSHRNFLLNGDEERVHIVDGKIDRTGTNRRTFPMVLLRKDKLAAIFLGGQRTFCGISDVKAQHRSVKLARLIDVAAVQKSR